MYVTRINREYQRWRHLYQPSKHLIWRDGSNVGGSHSFAVKSVHTERNLSSHYSLIERSTSSTILSSRQFQLRKYSSEGDGRNASEDKHSSVKDTINFDGKCRKEKFRDNVRLYNAHAQLGEQDQKEWLSMEKLSIESKKLESPFLTKREKLKKELLRRVVPWEKLSVSWNTFPYYLHDHTKNILAECAASHLKQKRFTASYGARLTSSSGRILLQSFPGTELYRERLVKALAQDLQVPLLMLDSSTLAPYDFGGSSECETDDKNVETCEELASDSEIENENDCSIEEEWTSSSEVKSDCSDNDEVDVQETAERALRKLVTYNLEKRLAGELDSSSDSSISEVKPSDKAKRPLKKGDRVKYVGPSLQVESDNRIILGKISAVDGPTNVFTIIRTRPLSRGQRGEIYEINGSRVAVILDDNEKENEGDEEDKSSGSLPKPPVHWMDVKDLELDANSQFEDCYFAMETLCEVICSVQPLIVYFQDFSQFLSSVPKSNRKEFVHKVQELFDQLSVPVVLICGQNKVESSSKENGKSTMILPNLGGHAKLPISLNRLTEGVKKATKRYDDNEISEFFSNILCIYPPKEDDILRTFNKQVEEDSRIVISRSNLKELHMILEEHEMSCVNLLQLNIDGVILTKKQAEKVVGWAKNHYLYNCKHPLVRAERLHIPIESLEMGISRLKEHKLVSQKSSQSLKNLAKDEYETNFVSAVVPPGEIGVKFEDIGALEDVKRSLNELVILPMRRPELFSRGNLLRPCKGILLFGPPGTGKTLLAKALATEAGANFISITGSTLTSKWFGDAEKLTKALFTFASKLAPVIIFVDEVDSLLGARGGGFEHEATRRMRNEFMAAWDGLRTKDSQRILILGATNRPFDLDDAVIRRLPRRIYVDLPDAENRLKILKIFLAQEIVETEFPFDVLANLTEGYSGSDLKNLCIAAAYRPVQELLSQESMGMKNDEAPLLRPLRVDDFVRAKAKVGPSVAYDAASMNELRKWNEQYGEGGSRRNSPFGFGNL